MINPEDLNPDPECTLTEFIALLRLGITDALPDVVAVAGYYLGFAFERLVQDAGEFNGLDNTVWLGPPPSEVWLAAPNQERTDVIRKALAIAYGLDPTHGVLWSREWPVGWIHRGDGQPVTAWVLRCAGRTVMFANDPDFMPFSLAIGTHRITVHNAAVETETDARAALALAVQHRLSEV